MARNENRWHIFLHFVTQFQIQCKQRRKATFIFWGLSQRKCRSERQFSTTVTVNVPKASKFTSIMMIIICAPPVKLFSAALRQDPITCLCCAQSSHRKGNRPIQKIGLFFPFSFFLMTFPSSQHNSSWKCAALDKGVSSPQLWYMIELAFCGLKVQSSSVPL